MLGITAIVACLAAGKLVHGAASPDKTYEVFAAVPGSMILAAGFMSTAASYADSYDDAMSTGAAVCNTLSGCIGYIVGSNGRTWRYTDFAGYGAVFLTLFLIRSQPERCLLDHHGLGA